MSDEREVRRTVRRQYEEPIWLCKKSQTQRHKSKAIEWEGGSEQ